MGDPIHLWNCKDMKNKKKLQLIIETVFSFVLD